MKVIEKDGRKLQLSENNIYSKLLQTKAIQEDLSKNLKIKVYETIILPVVLYGCETWFLTLREECKLRIFENRIRCEFLGPRG